MWGNCLHRVRTVPGIDAIPFAPGSGPQAVELLINDSIYYAEAALRVEESGADPFEERENFMDTIAELLHYIDSKYVEGMAATAARKKQWGYHAAVDTAMFHEILTHLASPDCIEVVIDKHLDYLVSILGVDKPEDVQSYARMGCGEAKHIIALLLLIPPQGVKP